MHFQELDSSINFPNQYSIDVKEWLKCHPEGKKLIPVFHKGTYSSSHRAALVRIVAKMVSICGNGVSNLSVHLYIKIYYKLSHIKFIMF